MTFISFRFNAVSSSITVPSGRDCFMGLVVDRYGGTGSRRDVPACSVSPSTSYKSSQISEKGKGGGSRGSVISGGGTISTH